MTSRDFDEYLSTTAALRRLAIRCQFVGYASKWAEHLICIIDDTLLLPIPVEEMVEGLHLQLTEGFNKLHQAFPNLRKYAYPANLGSAARQARQALRNKGIDVGNMDLRDALPLATKNGLVS